MATPSGNVSESEVTCADVANIGTAGVEVPSISLMGRPDRLDPLFVHVREADIATEFVLLARTQWLSGHPQAPAGPPPSGPGEGHEVVVDLDAVQVDARRPDTAEDEPTVLAEGGTKPSHHVRHVQSFRVRRQADSDE